MTAGEAVVFGAGVMAAFNPCGAAMLPAYILRLLTGRERRARDGLWAGLLMTAGFLFVFLWTGLLFLAFARLLGQVAFWLALAVGVGFIATGILLLLGKRGFSFHIGGRRQEGQGHPAIFAYGVAYALGSLGCTLPLFSLLVLSSFQTRGWLGGVMDFVLYALGMGTVVTALSLASAVSQQVAGAWVRAGSRFMGRLNGVITLGTGVYMVVYIWAYLGRPL